MILVSVAYATPAKQVEVSLAVEESCTVALAIHRSGILQEFPEIDLATAKVGIYSQPITPDAILSGGDRVEIYRPLRMDPKQARVLRVSHSRLSHHSRRIFK